MDDLGPDYAYPAKHQVRLFNSWQPSLKPGKYNIDVKQEIRYQKVGDPNPVEAYTLQNVDIAARQQRLQQFVIALNPFKLSKEYINSYYPPADQIEDSQTVPHVVFSDAHLPWNQRMALVVFDREDLFVPGTKDAAVQQQDGSFGMTARSFTERSHDFDASLCPDTELDSPISVIFPTRKRLADLLGPIRTLDDLRLLSHVRLGNTTDWPDPTKAHAAYSVLISSNFGHLESQVPKEVYVHLISLEGLKEPIVATDSSDSSQPMGIASLFSWSYKCQEQPDSRKILELRALGNSVDDYRRKLHESLPPTQNSPYYNHIRLRIEAGYAFSQWRLSTGERFVALLRGPLTPQPVPKIPVDPKGTFASSGDGISSKWPTSSNNGEDYQILDRDLSIPDLSYCAAWQLGRCQAIADRDFVAALHRIRLQVGTSAASRARKEANASAPPKDVTASLATTMNAIRNLSVLETGSPQRLSALSKDPVFTDLGHAALSAIYDTAMISSLSRLKSSLPRFNTLALQPTANRREDQKVSISNSDLDIVYNFLIDRLNLREIPIQYLFPNPNLCPLESLRFFCIDEAYVDCIIDGALSVANHMASSPDLARDTIKAWFHEDLPANGVRIPRSLVIINSFLIESIPELKVTVWCKEVKDGHIVENENPTRNPVISYSKTKQTTLRVLLDCLPYEISRLSISLPAHQLHYSVPFLPDDLNWARFRPFKPDSDPQKLTPWPENELNAENYLKVQSSKFVDKETRVIRLPDLENAIRAAIPSTDTNAAAMIAHQLTAHDVRFDIVPDPQDSIGKPAPDNKPRWRKPEQPPPTNPSTPAKPGQDETQPTVPSDPALHPLEPLPPSAAGNATTRLIPTLPAMSAIPPPGRATVEPLFKLTIAPNWVSISESTADKSTSYVFEPVFYLRRISAEPTDSRQLHSLDIYIPSGDEQQRIHPGSSAAVVSPGFLPRFSRYRDDSWMLRNIRFVTHMAGDTAWTRVRLLPRGGPGDFETETDGESLGGSGIGVGGTNSLMDVSFKIGRREIVDSTDGDRTKNCTVTLVERYWGQVGDGARRFAYACSTATVTRSPNEQRNMEMYR